MRIVDISLPVGSMTPVYPGDPAISVERVRQAAGGDTYSLSRLTMGSHAGTHMDPPAHFIPGGATAEALPLDVCIGPALVLDVPAGEGPVPADALNGLPAGTARVLVRTSGPMVGDRGLSPEAAQALVARGVRLVGIDGLSIAPIGSPGEVHHILLAAGVIILEGLDLSAVHNGPATLIALPLKLAGCDGAPSRAVLVYEGG